MCQDQNRNTRRPNQGTPTDPAQVLLGGLARIIAGDDPFEVVFGFTPDRPNPHQSGARPHGQFFTPAGADAHVGTDNDENKDEPVGDYDFAGVTYATATPRTSPDDGNGQNVYVLIPTEDGFDQNLAARAAHQLLTDAGYNVIDAQAPLYADDTTRFQAAMNAVFTIARDGGLIVELPSASADPRCRVLRDAGRALGVPTRRLRSLICARGGANEWYIDDDDQTADLLRATGHVVDDDDHSVLTAYNAGITIADAQHG